MEINKKTQDFWVIRQHSTSISASLAGSSISFSKPSYIPAMRMPMTNEAWSGHFQLGAGVFGVYGSIEAEVYGQKATIEAGDVEQKKPMVGYLYYEKCTGGSRRRDGFHPVE